MTLEIHPSTQEWILQKMEELTKEVMYNKFAGNIEVILEKIGEFRGLLNLLANSDYESMSLKFKVKLLTDEQYADSLPDDDGEN